MTGNKKNVNWLLFGFMIILVSVWLFPIFVTFLTALKTAQEASATKPWDLPVGFALLDNFTWAWRNGNLGQSFTRSILYAGLSSTVAIILAALAAFALVQLKVKRAFSWFLLIYAGTVFPFQMYLLPLFFMYQKLGIYDTQLGLFLFYTAIAIPFCLFVLRNNFIMLEQEIMEAAQLDGLSNFGVFTRMYLPQSVSAIAALFLFQFTWVWNDLLFGITLSKSPNVRPIMAGLAGLRGTFASQNIPGVLAGALLASVPTIFIFIMLGKYLLQGMVLTTSGE
ncbi:MAG: carbohydrate ABC transporter permease [Chloroflexi bacterium]|nr:carbohydrate ABC transporter permease [Chloroflexota bacterium]